MDLLDMDIGEDYENIKRDFWLLLRMFHKNFNRLNAAELKEFKIGVDRLRDILREKEKKVFENV